MIPAVILLPLLAGLLALAIGSDARRRALLRGTALLQAGLVAAIAWQQPGSCCGGWLACDTLALLFLGVITLLFLAAAFYATSFLASQDPDEEQDLLGGFLERESPTPERSFTACFLFFLGTMTLVCLSQHMGLLWVAIEATTLVTAPLIYFHREKGSLEATWKYLLICSVGIALALLGNFLLALASVGPDGQPGHLFLPDLLLRAPGLVQPWLKVAFIFFLVGYGTKMGLAPLHTWLPDAHSEAPPVVSALLSGALLNCAFLGLLRVVQICAGAGLLPWCQELLRLFGGLSLVTAAIFLIAQRDYKRMLAYSSVEHMGICALGVGLGGGGIVAALFHVINHALSKSMLFMLAGNIYQCYHTKIVAAVTGVARRLPITGLLWIAGFFAITGTPPFGTFHSELGVLRSAIEQDRWGVALIFLGSLALAFIGMAGNFLRMAQGEPEPGVGLPGLGAQRERLSAILPPLVLGLLVLALGLWVPQALTDLLYAAARLVAGG